MVTRRTPRKSRAAPLAQKKAVLPQEGWEPLDLDSLGFKLSEPRDGLVPVLMPPGWAINKTSDTRVTELRDAHCRRRALIYAGAEPYMKFLRRYGVKMVPSGCGEPRVHVTDSEEIWFTCASPDPAPALRWLDENYPHWRHTSTYWN